MAIDFDAIWKQQEISPALSETLEAAARTAQYAILRPQGGVRNISEWAKKEDCWKAVKRTAFSMSSALESELVTLEDQIKVINEGEDLQAIDNGIDAQVRVLQCGADFWKAISTWGVQNRHLTAKDMGILTRVISASNGGRIPTERQSQYLVQLVGRLVREGCPHTMP